MIAEHQRNGYGLPFLHNAGDFDPAIMGGTPLGGYHDQQNRQTNR
jgi:hypothetical protein